MDIIIYIIMLVLVSVLAVGGLKLWSGLALFGAIIGAVFSYMCFSDVEIVFNTTWSETQQAFVSQTYPMQFFSFVPLVLTLLCFILIIKK